MGEEKDSYIIIGVDGALRCTGYAIIRVVAKKFQAIDCGVIVNKKNLSVSDCLRRIAGGLEELIGRYQPSIAAIEGGFYFRNAKTAMILGMVRGSVITMLARAKIPAYEYAPRKAKQMVVGHGGASKEQVAQAMAQLLSLDHEAIPTDATDAMAIAICHAVIHQCAHGLYLPKPI